MTTKIIGTGSCLPKAIVTNDDLSAIMDTNDEWIRSRTGIGSRHLAKKETTASMSIEAAKKALEDANISADDLDLIIVGTLSGDYITPSTACEVQAALGATNAFAFDVNAACTGFEAALHIAHMYIKGGMAKHALVIGAETLSKIMDWNDRSTCVLFGDGAGAAVVTADHSGILGFVQGSDGAKGMSLAGQDRKNNNPLIKNDTSLSYVHMDGQEVYKFAVSTVPRCIKEALEQAGVEIEDIKYFILHQANIRIIQSVAKRLKQPESKFPTILEECGNMSAASIPVLLDHVNRQGKLESGDKIVMAGFGGGLTWGATVVEW